QEEQKALATARAVGIGEDVGGSSEFAGRAARETARFANGASERRQRRAQLPFPLEILGKALTERSRCALNAARPNEQPGQVLAPVDAVFPPVEPSKDIELIVGH